MKYTLPIISLLIASSISISARKHECICTQSVDTESVNQNTSSIDQQAECFTDTIGIYNQNIYILKHNLDPSSTIPASIITYNINSQAIDTCHIYNIADFSIKGSYLIAKLGIDSISYDLESLPDHIEPIKDEISSFRPFDENYYTYVNEFTSFGIHSYIPKKQKAWIYNFISNTIQNDINGMFMLENSPNDEICNGLNSKNITIQEISDHYSDELQRLYNDLYSQEELEEYTPKYEYQININPAWISNNGKWITYHIESYTYTGGAHGYSQDYYLTFNTKNGKVLGYKDIYGTKNFAQAIASLEQQIKQYKKSNELLPAYVEGTSDSTKITKEMYHDHLYPRAAMTNKGVVFSYQPYEIASFAEGTLHFIIPYSQLKAKNSSK